MLNNFELVKKKIEEIQQLREYASSMRLPPSALSTEKLLTFIVFPPVVQRFQH